MANGWSLELSSLNGISLLKIYTELEDANTKSSKGYAKQDSKIFKKPVILLSKYEWGFIKEYLTPGLAKFTT